MLPAYHWVAAQLISRFGEGVLGPRVLSSLFAGIGVAAAAAFLRQQAARRDAGDALLQFAWNPLWFPFVALAYTDVPSIALVVAALAFQARSAFALCGIAMLAAALVRQTALVWSGWIILHEALIIREAYDRHDISWRAASLAWLRRTWPQLIVIAAAIGIVAYFGRFTPGRSEWNRIGFNPAQLYLFALAIVMMWLPLIVSRAAGAWKRIGTSLLTRAHGIAAVLGLIAFLMLSYRSTHGWNTDLWYVRNWPLQAMAASLSWRLGLVLLIIAAAPPFYGLIHSQPERRAIWLVVGVATAFAATQELADPRYYIMSTMLVNLLLRLEPMESRMLTIWYAALSALIALAVVFSVGGSGGGVW